MAEANGRHQGYCHRIVAKIALFAFLILTSYAGLYLLLLDPEKWGTSNSAYIWEGRVPRYRVGGTAAEYVFQPAHTIDRRLRPNYWTIEYVEIGIVPVPQEVRERYGR